MIGGIFVGGAGRRMGGAPKGLLRAARGETIVARLARAMREAGVEPVLVGAHGAYASLGLRAIPDAAPDTGPLGGLVALLEEARGPVIAVACDMPYVTEPLVRKLAAAPDAPAVAARRDGRWEPLFARYDAARVLGAARARLERGELALQGLLDEVGAVVLALSHDEAAKLDDWDTPEDVGSAANVKTAAFDASGARERDDRVAVEDPLEIRCGREPIAVTMRTPGADEELAVGFLLGEGVVRARSDVVSVATPAPHAVSVELVDAARARLPSAERRFFTTSSCGVCGKASLDRVRAALPEDRAPDATTLSASAVTRLPDLLREAQQVFDRTGGLHAAGLFRAAPEPELVGFAEDVGRHNAVDKVLGAELLAGRVPLPGHVLVLSGRAAFELVQKAAIAGVSAIVAIGAPTSLAVELAESTGLVLVGFARGERFNVYAGRARVVA